MRNLLLVTVAAVWMMACGGQKKAENARKATESQVLADSIRSNQSFKTVMEMAKGILKTGFTAGDGYGEVWIRDFNTFLELSCQVQEHTAIKKNLLIFFYFQGEDGNIVDGYIPKEKAHTGGYDYRYSDLAPEYAAHKNTVETDQEASLVQAVWKYVQTTGDKAFLAEKVEDKTVLERLEWSMDFLLKHRYNEEYGLLWGATTADWGDVQPEHDWGVYLTDDTHYAIDIYDNAMFVIAINNFLDLAKDDAGKVTKWEVIRDEIATNTMKHLWNGKKFIPHIYLNGSPFSEDLEEDAIFYHGGTAVAIEAGLLNKEQIQLSLKAMQENVKNSGAASIGLTLYPTYPEGSFKNKGMGPYSYQNGGDWTWFGGRMIQALITHGFVKEAYQELLPMTDRVVANKGFFEWYTVDNQPKGSGIFRGSAGVLAKSIMMLEEWAGTVESQP
ncbi:hypothetical protein AAG747_22215 [Rapidithrix thailandica]|uniref:Glycosyl hydrolase 94 catalytic domain-containing protein n=1 Tax=Rapidithrix thailandica TaxID=413964 RepID=A0AAW9SCE1_9BACT